MSSNMYWYELRRKARPIWLSGYSDMLPALTGYYRND
jgi:hypothetical protein